MFKKVLKGLGKIVGVFLFAFIVSATVSLIGAAFGGIGLVVLILALFIIGAIAAIRDEIQKGEVYEEVSQEYLDKEKEFARIADELFDKKVRAMTDLQVALQTEDKELTEQCIGVIYKIIELFNRLGTENGYRYADWTERQLDEVLKTHNYSID